MPTVLDNFIVLFGEEGAKKLERTIDDIGRAVVNSVKKSIEAHKQLEKRRESSIKNLTKANKERHKLSAETSKIEERTMRKTVPLYKQLADSLAKREKLEKSISGLSKNTIKYQQQRNALAKENAKIADIESRIKRQQAREEERSLRRRNKIILATAATVAMVGRSAFREQNWALNVRRQTARLTAAYTGAGVSERNAQGFDEYLGRFGGERGEGVNALRNINAQIGAMRYGDTGLVQTLGTFGISGIGAQSTSKDVLKAIMQRAQGMDDAEREAMLNALGFTDAMKLMVKKGDIEGLEKEATPYSFEEKQMKLLEETYKAEESYFKKAIEAADKLSPIEEAVNTLKENFGEFWNIFKALDLTSFISAGLAYFAFRGFRTPIPTSTPPTGSPKALRPSASGTGDKIFNEKTGRWHDAKTGKMVKTPTTAPKTSLWGKAGSLGGKALRAIGSTPVMAGQLLLTPNQLGGGDDLRGRDPRTGLPARYEYLEGLGLFTFPQMEAEAIKRSGEILERQIINNTTNNETNFYYGDYSNSYSGTPIDINLNTGQ